MKIKLTFINNFHKIKKLYADIQEKIEFIEKYISHPKNKELLDFIDYHIKLKTSSYIQNHSNMILIQIRYFPYMLIWIKNNNTFSIRLTYGYQSMINYKNGLDYEIMTIKNNILLTCLFKPSLIKNNINVLETFQLKLEIIYDFIQKIIYLENYYLQENYNNLILEKSFVEDYFLLVKSRYSEQIFMKYMHLLYQHPSECKCYSNKIAELNSYLDSNCSEFYRFKEHILFNSPLDFYSWQTELKKKLKLLDNMDKYHLYNDLNNTLKNTDTSILSKNKI